MNIRNFEVPWYLDTGSSKVWYVILYVEIKLWLFWNFKPVKNMGIKKLNVI